MKNDKNKVMILVALGVVMLGVGAFSFMGGSKPEPAPVTKKSEPNAETTSQTQGEQEPTPTPTGGPVAEGTSTIDPATGEPVVNPNGNPNGTPTGDPKLGAPPENEVSVLVDPEAVRVAKLSLRDPFNGNRWDPMNDIKPVTQNATPPPQPRPRSNGGSRPRPMGGQDFRPLPVDANGLNPVGGGSGTIGSGNPGQMPNYDDVPYTVNGIVSGANSAAIVTDGQGKQRIVKVGSSLDPDTKVLGVENGKVIVRYRGKVKTISINNAGAPTTGGNKPPQNQ